MVAIYEKSSCQFVACTISFLSKLINYWAKFMSLELIKSSARLFGGSAVAGMGFSFGRDIYRGATKNNKKNAILVFILIALAVFGTYTSGVWIGRNYQTLWGSIFKRIGSLFILAPSFAFLLFLGVFFTGASDSTTQDIEQATTSVSDYPELIRLESAEAIVSEVKLRWNDGTPSIELSRANGLEGWVCGTQIAPEVWEFAQNKFYSLTLDFARNSFSESEFDGTSLPEVKGSWTMLAKEPIKPRAEIAVVTATQSQETATDQAFHQNFSVALALVLPCSALAIGLISGAFQRGKRKLVWEAERANSLFMQQNGLIEHEDSTLEDSTTGQNYRIEHIGMRRITLFPIGRRGKRAYINIAPDGKYFEFTGMIAV